MDTGDEHELWGWRSFFDQITQFLNEAERHSGSANDTYALYVVERLEVCICNILRLKAHLSENEDASAGIMEVVDYYQSNLSELLYYLEKLSNHWTEYYDRIENPDFSCLPYSCGSSQWKRASTTSITQNQMEYLRSLSFTWCEIAAILGISRMTLYRRRCEYGMLGDNPSVVFSDSELQEILTHMRQEYPEFGETMAMGHLRARWLSCSLHGGYHVTRERLRKAVHVTDPINTALRNRATSSIQ